MVYNFTPDSICCNSVYALCPGKRGGALIAITGKRTQTGIRFLPQEEALVQTANKTNILLKFVQTIFLVLYVPYKTRLLPMLKKDKY